MENLSNVGKPPTKPEKQEFSKIILLTLFTKVSFIINEQDNSKMFDWLASKQTLLLPSNLLPIHCRHYVNQTMSKLCKLFVR